MRAFTIILGVTKKTLAFESQPEINGFVEKLLIFFSDQFALLAIKRKVLKENHITEQKRNINHFDHHINCVVFHVA